MKRIWSVFMVLFLAVAFWQCGTQEVEYTPVSFERFDQELMQVNSEKELQSLLIKHPDLCAYLLGGQPDDTTFISDIFSMIQHPEIKKLYAETQNTFGDLSTLSNDFGKAFAQIKLRYPDFKEPRMVIGFSGLENDMIVNDTLVVLSLESFVGPKASYRPSQPDYILNRYAPEYIVPNVIRYLSNQFNEMDFSKDDFTSDLVFFGKSLMFCREVLPAVPDSILLGYSNIQMQQAFENQDIIWEHVIDRELLNNTNPATNQKFFGERPYMAEISPDCPPRIGQWLGLRIVELYYQKQKDMTLVDLMKIKDAEAILRGSKYRGQKDK